VAEENFPAQDLPRFSTASTFSPMKTPNRGKRCFSCSTAFLRILDFQESSVVPRAARRRFPGGDFAPSTLTVLDSACTCVRIAFPRLFTRQRYKRFFCSSLIARIFHPPGLLQQASHNVYRDMSLAVFWSSKFKSNFEWPRPHHDIRCAPVRICWHLYEIL